MAGFGHPLGHDLRLDVGTRIGRSAAGRMGVTFTYGSALLVGGRDHHSEGKQNNTPIV